MKNYYFFLVLIVSFSSNGQTPCDDANSYLISAYSHVKDAYDSNNISHLKYYANRSIESFKLSKKTLKACGCEAALDLTDKGIEILKKVEDVETFEDGRFFVKRARDSSKQSVIEIDKCTTANYNKKNQNELEHDVEVDNKENNELEQLKSEQLKLKQQQEALKLKEAQIKTKLAEQKDKELTIEKKQLIISYKNAIASNIKIYNETLKICDCNHNLVTHMNTSDDLSSEHIEEIKKYYNTSLKALASDYLSQLNLCSN